MVTTLSLTQYFGLIVLAPIVLGAVIYALALAGRANRAAVLALAVLGAVIPALTLLFVIPAMSLGDPVAIQPFGLRGHRVSPDTSVAASSRTQVTTLE